MLTSKRTNAGDLSNHQGEPNSRPSTFVGKSQKSRFGIGMRSQDPKHNDNGNEAKDVYSKDGVLHHRKNPRAPDVKGNANEHDRDDEQESLPAWGIKVGVLDDAQGLDQGTDKEATRGVSSLPTERREPARAVTQDLLVLLRAEFTDLFETISWVQAWEGSLLTQWYCPPAVGAMEAISARDAVKKAKPMSVHTSGVGQNQFPIG